MLCFVILCCEQSLIVNLTSASGANEWETQFPDMRFIPARHGARVDTSAPWPRAVYPTAPDWRPLRPSCHQFILCHHAVRPANRPTPAIFETPWWAAGYEVICIYIVVPTLLRRRRYLDFAQQLLFGFHTTRCGISGNNFPIFWHSIRLLFDQIITLRFH